MILNTTNQNRDILRIRELVFNKIKTLSLEEQNIILNYTNITNINNFVIQDIYMKFPSENSCLLYFFKRDNEVIIETPLGDLFDVNLFNPIIMNILKTDIIDDLKKDHGYKISFCDNNGILLELENNLINRLKLKQIINDCTNRNIDIFEYILEKNSLFIPLIDLKIALEVSEILSIMTEKEKCKLFNTINNLPNVENIRNFLTYKKLLYDNIKSTWELENCLNVVLDKYDFFKNLELKQYEPIIFNLFLIHNNSSYI